MLDMFLGAGTKFEAKKKTRAKHLNGLWMTFLLANVDPIRQNYINFVFYTMQQSKKNKMNKMNKMKSILLIDDRFTLSTIPL